MSAGEILSQTLRMRNLLNAIRALSSCGGGRASKDARLLCSPSSQFLLSLEAYSAGPWRSSAAAAPSMGVEHGLISSHFLVNGRRFFRCRVVGIGGRRQTAELH